ncbi:unnamed protein product [Haemonchus placei]|uniref:Transducin/WD40 repeat-like superfamily protein n=1 Tax=Haemonchus placei TaxID=6290 RepID=A0A0N4VWB4_HAEPC|nr:unnamed protein product [Haemonchus placei]
MPLHFFKAQVFLYISITYLGNFFLSGLSLSFILIGIQVTLEGDPVCPFNGGHKLPYERLLFASRAECSTLYSAISSSDGKVFASVPMAVPSRKPPVVPIVKQYGVVAKQPLELFARSLLPYTVSVGYEALLLQSSLCLISLNKDNEV